MVLTKPDVYSNSVKIPGYSLYGSGRFKRRGAGVALYISNRLDFPVVEAPEGKLLIGIVYLSHNDVYSFQRAISVTF